MLKTLRAHLFRWWYRKSMQLFAGLPGPTPTVPFGTGTAFLGRNTWEVCAQYGKEFGPLTVIWLGGQPAVVLNDPELIGQVLDTKHEDFYKDAPCAALRPVITPACPFTANGADWKLKRQNHPLEHSATNGWLETQVAPLRQALVQESRQLVLESSHHTLDLTKRLLRCHSIFFRWPCGVKNWMN